MNQIDQWLAECEGATPGWTRDRSLEAQYGICGQVVDAMGNPVASNGRGGNNQAWIDEQERNLDFIASARTRLPAALRALKVAVEELEEAANGYGTKREAQKALDAIAKELGGVE